MPTAIPKTRLIIIGIGLILLVGIVLIFIFGSRTTGTTQNISLNFWGVESPQAIQAITDVLPKNFKITYKAFDASTYESELINALAAGKGPDIFMVNSRWLPKHADKLVPASQDQISATTLQSLFPTVVTQDFAPDKFVYALPLYIDTLALIYNRDIFDSKGIATPPKTWKDIEGDISKLRERDKTGKLIKAAFALGGSEKNITHASDILSLLMLQAGVPMVANDFSKATFAQGGKMPLAFYTKFANPADPSYTWNDNFPSSIDSFAAGNTASVIGYADDIKKIKEKNPFLPMLVTSVPQSAESTTEVNYADYWGIGVSNKFSNPQGAWNFILSFLTDPQLVKTYTVAASRLPALRILLTQAQSDATWSTFAKSALSARSWPQIDNNAVEKSFSQMITDVTSGITPETALKKSEDTISALMARPRP